MMFLLSSGLKLLYLSTLVASIPLSIIEDAKASQTHFRSNKVKRAQEVVMFGNQQNKIQKGDLNFAKPEKREVSGVEDNTLSEVVSLPQPMPQFEENGYDTNRLDLDRLYQYRSEEPLLTLMLMAESLREPYNYNGSPGTSTDYQLRNYMNERRKRDTKTKTQGKTSVSSQGSKTARSKRDSDISPEELLAYIRFLEAETRNRYNPAIHEQRLGWPVYSINTDDDINPDLPEEEFGEPEPEYPANVEWMEAPVHPTAKLYWPRQHKRYMITKRNTGRPFSHFSGNEEYNGVPLYHRMIL